MTTIYNSQGQSISLLKEVASGGEGIIWTTNLNGTVAKIYKEEKATSQLQEKVKVMIANPPNNPTQSQNHIAIAWPRELLNNQNGKFCGYLMPCINNSKSLVNVYSPHLRKKYSPDFNWLYLHAYNSPKYCRTGSGTS